MPNPMTTPLSRLIDRETKKLVGGVSRPGREHVVWRRVLRERFRSALTRISKATVEALGEKIEGYAIRHPFDGFRRDTYESAAEVGIAKNQLEAYHNVEHTAFALIPLTTLTHLKGEPTKQ